MCASVCVRVCVCVPLTLVLAAAAAAAVRRESTEGSVEQRHSAVRRGAVRLPGFVFTGLPVRGCLCLGAASKAYLLSGAASEAYA